MQLNRRQFLGSAAAAAAFSGREAAAGRLSGSEKRHFLQAKKTADIAFFSNLEAQTSLNR